MEGHNGNFDDLLSHFQSSLRGVDFVAIDLELTGVDVPGQTDKFYDTGQERFDRLCTVGEDFSIIQLGLTVARRSTEEQAKNSLCLTTYNLFTFPFAEDDRGGHERFFMCTASAVQFNSHHNLDFNAWVRDGVRFMNRKEEAKFVAERGNDEQMDARTGVLRLWKLLCDANTRLVVHCPLDLFFLLASFEERPLPRDPRTFSRLVRRCFKEVVDTAHLYDAIGRFRRRGLTKFYYDAKAYFDKWQSEGDDRGAVRELHFSLEEQTAARYNEDDDDFAAAHEAGYDSLLTAQLYAYLRACFPAQAAKGGNKLFLYNSVECIDLDTAETQGRIARSAHDLRHVDLFVADLAEEYDSEVGRVISQLGNHYQWMEPSQLLVHVREREGRDRRASLRELKSSLGHKVSRWSPMEEWRSAVRQQAAKRPATSGGAKTEVKPAHQVAVPTPAVETRSCGLQVRLGGSRIVYNYMLVALIGVLLGAAGSHRLNGLISWLTKRLRSRLGRQTT
eukprot:TRINITY_DN64793_c0_g1_i1.p1 TRINITY_DN64793_c0_g1~~TRINITY_DN64793_c0_g1_i1.p1  ORF type:complete len:544 (-),score=95.05 TRINITY_DN64793_c0_g1_i1:2-1513(-)